MPDAISSATDRLVDAINNLQPREDPRTAELRSAWRDLGATWIVEWARSLGRDVTNAAAALERAEAAGATEEGATEVENALWRVDAAFEKLHDVIALGFGVPALKLNKNRKGIKRFESDRRANRKRVRDLVEQHHVAQQLLDLDEQIATHRFLELRHQLTHSLAPILAWQSLLWFEVAEIDEKGGVTSYSSRHLTPSDSLQGTTPPDQLYPCTIADGRAIVVLLIQAISVLAALMTTVGNLEPPPVLWRVTQTGEVFFDRSDASQAAHEASGYVSPFDPA
jgi:hypothetical protein